MKRYDLRYFPGLVIFMLLLAGCGSDEDKPAVVDFQSDASSFAEGNDGAVSFNLPLPAGVEPIITLGGTAEENVDYTYAFSSGGVVFTIADDGLYDPDETIVITLTGFNKGAVPGVKKVHTIKITEAPLVVEFQAITATRTEGQSIVAAFNQPLPAAVVPTYRITGTAQASDYTATLGTNGFVVAVAKDEVYDNNETIIIELTAISGNASLASKKIFTITLTDEDESTQAGLKIDLTWDALDLGTSDVDVDLLVWLETAPGVFTSQGGLWSAIIGTSPESTFIPVNEVDGKYALSYVYYGGTSDNLKIKADFRSYKGNINGTSNRASFSKTYTKVNINSYSDPYLQPLVVAQRFDKVSGDYLNLSDILVAGSGSRMGNYTFILDEKARRVIEAKQKQNLLKNIR